MLAERRPSRRIRLGTVDIGDGAPISIQSMTITKTEDVGATLIQVHALATQGPDIVRVAVPHEGDARALPAIVAQAGVPIVADIHFSYRLALMALEAGVQGLRLNPGNIRDNGQIRTAYARCLAVTSDQPFSSDCAPVVVDGHVTGAVPDEQAWTFE